VLVVLIASFCEKLRLREPPGKNDLKRAQDFLLSPSKYLPPFILFHFDSGTLRKHPSLAFKDKFNWNMAIAPDRV